MDLNKIKTGRPKPKFVIALEWLTIASITVAACASIYSNLFSGDQLFFNIISFLVLIEIGILSILYGMEGIRYRIIWFTFPSFSGPKRKGFSGIGAFLIGGTYVLLGLFLILIAIFSAYLQNSQ